MKSLQKSSSLWVLTVQLPIYLPFKSLGMKQRESSFWSPTVLGISRRWPKCLGTYYHTDIQVELLGPGFSLAGKTTFQINKSIFLKRPTQSDIYRYMFYSNVNEISTKGTFSILTKILEKIIHFSWEMEACMDTHKFKDLWLIVSICILIHNQKHIR